MPHPHHPCSPRVAHEVRFEPVGVVVGSLGPDHDYQVAWAIWLKRG